jgi:hypothetical protein
MGYAPPGRPDPLKSLEQQPNCLLDLLVGIQPNMFGPIVDQPHRQWTG